MNFENFFTEIENDWLKIIGLVLILSFLIVKEIIVGKSSKKDKAKQNTILSAISYKLDMLIDQYKNHLTSDAAITLLEHTLNYNKYNLLSYLRRIIYINNIKENKEQIEQKIEMKIANLSKESRNKLHKFKYKDIELSEYIGDTYILSSNILEFLLTYYEDEKLDEKLEDYLNISFDSLIIGIIDRLN